MDIILSPLTLVTFFPLVGVGIILLLKEQQRKAVQWAALLTGLVEFGIALWVLSVFNPAEAGLQMEKNLFWFQIVGVPVNFQLGVDSLSILMVLLTTLLTPLAMLSSWRSVQENVRAFMSLFLLMETAMLGVFLSLDIVLFFVFWEFTLIPMYFIIGMWGGSNRIFATTRFFLFTMAGSILMLAATLFIGSQAGTFSLEELVQNRDLFAGQQMWLFVAFAVAFGVKVPLFLLHSWLPDAHTEAPAAGSVILAGVMLKMGSYGFLRFNLPLFPEASFQAAPVMAGLAVAGIIYGAIVAFAQKDVKRLVAYSSVSHMGFVILGIFTLTADGISGAVLQMVNHGVSTGALFLIVGMLYERRHTRQMEDYGGLWKTVPVMGSLMLVTALSSMGLPGLNGFIGEFTILLSSYGSPALGAAGANVVLTVLASLGVVLAAIYLLHMFEKVFLGQVKLEVNKKISDLRFDEILVLLPLLVLMFWIGFSPNSFLRLIVPGAEQLANLIQATAVAIH